MARWSPTSRVSSRTTPARTSRCSFADLRAAPSASSRPSAWPTSIDVEIAGPDADDTRVDHAILECVARFGGSISAEHGVGRAKAGELNPRRSAEEIAPMRAIKRALDPAGLMNPGVLFES